MTALQGVHRTNTSHHLTQEVLRLETRGRREHESAALLVDRARLGGGGASRCDSSVSRASPRHRVARADCASGASRDCDHRDHGRLYRDRRGCGNGADASTDREICTQSARAFHVHVLCTGYRDRRRLCCLREPLRRSTSLGFDDAFASLIVVAVVEVGATQQILQIRRECAACVASETTVTAAGGSCRTAAGGGSGPPVTGSMSPRALLNLLVGGTGR